jgi:hypothetical protein
VNMALREMLTEVLEIERDLLGPRLFDRYLDSPGQPLTIVAPQHGARIDYGTAAQIVIGAAQLALMVWQIYQERPAARPEEVRDTALRSLQIDLSARPGIALEIAVRTKALRELEQSAPAQAKIETAQAKMIPAEAPGLANRAPEES